MSFSGIREIFSDLSDYEEFQPVIQSNPHFGSYIRATPSPFLSQVVSVINPIGYDCSRLASGGCGFVWKVEHKLTGRVDVVKTAKIEGDPSIRIELEILKRIQKIGSHPNIVEFIEEVEMVFDAGSYEGIKLKWYEQGSLRGVLHAMQSHANVILPQIYQGLSFLHHNNILHADLKLDNILIETEGPHVKAVISDFGLSVTIGSIASPIGTTKYAAPELFELAQYPFMVFNRSMDWYSFGMVSLEVLLGKESSKVILRSEEEETFIEQYPLHPEFASLATILRYKERESPEMFIRQLVS